ncbi:hypothetical protein FHS16_006379 [Paenibacillus endophyticus]|uniref:Uncharacterized protein n=1 Tax=Paenibacillus endophyticus TaxID=1294268 RepID=A0A7W5CEK5_9BACL|nr:hypothetical protein [Paenibacillus endophyticus]MBB3156257.1 hypothetical protein [Paenibacillus endophyticus]
MTPSKGEKNGVLTNLPQVLSELAVCARCGKAYEIGGYRLERAAPYDQAKASKQRMELHPNAAGDSDVTMLQSFFLKPDSGLAA